MYNYVIYTVINNNNKNLPDNVNELSRKRMGKQIVLQRPHLQNEHILPLMVVFSYQSPSSNIVFVQQPGVCKQLEGV